MKAYPARLALPAIVLLTASSAFAQTTLTQMAEFAIREANQGVGVDEDHFYAVDDRTIAKYTKAGHARGQVGGPGDRPDHPPRQRHGDRRQDLRLALELPLLPHDQLDRGLGREDDEAHRQPQHRHPAGLADLAGQARRPLVGHVRQLRPHRPQLPDGTNSTLPYGGKIQHHPGEVRRELAGAAGLDLPGGAAGQVRRHEQLGRLLGARRPPVPDRPRPGRGLQDPLPHRRLDPRGRGDHPRQHPRPGHRLGSIVERGRAVRDHPRHRPPRSPRARPTGWWCSSPTSASGASGTTTTTIASSPD